MKIRDLNIIDDLERFRVMTRNDIIDLHFSDLKQPVTCANTVLKRLRRDGHIEVRSDVSPYMYFPAPSGIKKDSAKIPHFLKIVDFYKSLVKYEVPTKFIVEPKYGKGYMEPDAFMIFKRAPFFVEIQRSVYSEKMMADKVSRYESYFFSDEWQSEPWQPKNGLRVFPKVIMITNTRYDINNPYLTILQISDIEQLINMQAQTVEQIVINGSGLKLKA